MTKKTTTSTKKQTPAPAPVPEPIKLESKPEEEPQNTNEQLFKEILTDLNAQKVQINAMINNVKKLQKEFNKELKSTKKKKTNKDPSKKREPSGFAKPTKISKELCDFLGKQYGTEMARTEVTKYLTQYIKEHQLQFASDKRKIIPDAPLKKLLFNGQKEDEVTYFNLQKWMKPHFQSNASISLA